MTEKNGIIESDRIVGESVLSSVCELVLSSVNIFVHHASNKVRVLEMAKVLRK